MAATANDARGGFQIRGLRKRFGNTQALDGVNLDLPSGRVTGIAGPNGAGKSTLIRILAGESSADEGTIDVDGSPWSPKGDQVAVVHQEPQLFPNLTVAQNLLVGRERTRAAWPSPTQTEWALMRQLELTNQSDRALGECSLAIQQRTEIARAVGADSRLLLFDEPNSALSPEESQDLFRILAQLAQQGRVVVLVSHRLGELVANCSSVAIIRDGRVTSELAGVSLSAEQIAERLVAGHAGTAGSIASQPQAPVGPLLGIRSWTHVDRAFSDIDMTLQAGQIAAVVGVEGSGAREFVRSIAGLERARGTRWAPDPDDAAAMSVAYIGPDRREALFFNLSVAENIAARLDDDRVSRFGMVRRSGVRDVGRSWVARFNIRVQSIDQPVGSLSGGNQQKVVVAAAAATDPKILILEEPTRGVDVSSKKDIHDLLKEFARSGHGVLMYTTEVVEAFEAADELHVIVAGRLAGRLRVQDFGDVESLASQVTVLESRR